MSSQVKLLVLDKYCHEKYLFLTKNDVFPPQNDPKGPRPQVGCYDVKMTCKKCYRKLYPFNPKIGLYHVT